ncbi:hypothetical protein G4B88_029802, partial [Cannabis sativa]
LILSALSKNQKDALAEVTDVLRAICHAHRFLLALTGIPCLNKGTSNEVAMGVEGGLRCDSNTEGLVVESSMSQVYKSQKKSASRQNSYSTLIVKMEEMSDVKMYSNQIPIR